MMQIKGWTHSLSHINIRRRDLFALLVGYFHFPHVPNTESSAIKLRPDIMPTCVMGFLAIRIPFEFVHEGTREIYLLRVCHSERDGRADFRMKGGFIGRGLWLLVWKWRSRELLL